MALGDTSSRSTDVNVENKTDESEAVIEKSEESLVESVEDKLQEIFSPESKADETEESSESTPEEKEEEKPAEKDDEEEESTPEDEEQEEESGKEGEEEATEEEAEEGDTKQELNDAYVRAAIHNGWTEEEINDLHKNNPKLALKTFGNIYESFKRANKEFADIGRIHKENQKKQADAKAEAVEEKKKEFKVADIDKLREDNPDSGALVDLVETMQEQNKALFTGFEELKTSVANSSKQSDANSENAKADADMAEIEKFFIEGAKGYETFYGVVSKDAKTWNEDLSPGQLANRWAVVQFVDDMLTGARVHGRELKIGEALMRAHLNVSDSFKEQVIRKEIASKVVKRSKSVSLKPSNTSQPANNESGKPKSDKEVEDRAAARLAKTFS